MVILVNNAYENDPRVNRCVTAAKTYFHDILVLSGVPKFKDKTQKIDGKITIKRYFYYKPNFSNSKIIKEALNIVTESDKKNTASLSKKKGKYLVTFVRNFLFMCWFFYIMLMNFLIFLRFIKIKADIYYANDFDTLFASHLLSSLHHANLIYDSHEIYPELIINSPKFYKTLIEQVEGPLSRKASAVITVNHPISKILKEKYHLSSYPNVIYNTPYYKAPSDIYHRKINPPFKILYHGMYLPGRNLEGLVKSMKWVTNLILYLRGYGVLEQPLRSLVSNEGLSEKVVFLEPVAMKNMVASATDYDLGIIPYTGSTKELNSYFCTPNKVFEYMMAGLALAVSDLPVLREIVITNDNGIVFDPTNLKNIAESLNRLTIDNLHRMRTNSLNAAKKKYNYNIESIKLIKIFRNVSASI